MNKKRLEKSELDAALLDAHQKKDSEALVMLYSKAGSEREDAGDIDAACFYFTHAYVFALESGDQRASSLIDVLLKYGREAKP